MDGSIFDEVIHFQNLKKDDEIQKFFIPDDLNEKEWVSYIVKKGFVIQKLAMINKIPFYKNDPDLIEFTFLLIMEYIEIWDDCLQYALASSIYIIYSVNTDRLKTFTNMNIIVNPVIKFCMKIISTEISEDYLKAYTALVKFYSDFKKVKLDPETIDYACNMGSFGKNTTYRRYSVYFCSSLIQISDEFSHELYNRIFILSSDSDKIVNLEMAYNFRFIFRDYLDDKFIKQNILKSLESYLTNEDLFYKSEVIVSIILNLNKINEDYFIQNLMNLIGSIFDNSSNDFFHVAKIFEALIQEFKFNNNSSNIRNSNLNNNNMNNIITINLSNLQIYSKNIFNAVKLFIKKYVLNKDISCHPTPHVYNVFIDKFPIIYQIFHNFKETIIIGDILNFIYKNFQFFCTSFIENFHIILNTIPCEDSLNIRSCNIKFSQIIDDKDRVKLIIKNLINILPFVVNNIEFVSIIYNKYDILEDYIKISIKNGWSEAYLFFKSFIKSEFIFENQEFTKKVYTLIIKFINIYINNEKNDSTNEASGIHGINNEINGINGSSITDVKLTYENVYINYKISKICMKTLSYVLKYSYKPQRVEILNFLNKYIVENKSFYKRRLYLPFLKKSVEIFSIVSLKENCIIENSFRFFDDYHILLPYYVEILKKIYPLVSDDPKIKFVILSKFETLKKVIPTQKNLDIESFKSLKNFDKWYLNFLKNTNEFADLFKEDQRKQKLENRLLLKESNEFLTEKKDDLHKKVKKIKKKIIYAPPKLNEKELVAKKIPVTNITNSTSKKSSSNNVIAINVHNTSRRYSVISHDKTKNTSIEKKKINSKEKSFENGTKLNLNLNTNTNNTRNAKSNNNSCISNVIRK